MLTGTILNAIAILVGSGIGILAGNRFPQKIQQSIMNGIGLVVIVIALQNALGTGNIIIPLLSLVIGAVIGELLDLDGALKRLGGWLQQKTTPPGDESSDVRAQARIKFITGFVTASLVFCVGPLAIIGSMQTGIDGDIKLIAIKSILDFFASVAFASSFGVGVAFSSLPVFVVQAVFAIFGALLATTLASGVSGLNASPYIRELTAAGGLILLGLGFMLLDIKQLRVANYLPALLIAPLLVGLAGLLHIPVYPL